MAAGLILEQGIVNIHVKVLNSAVKKKSKTWYFSTEGINNDFEVSLTSSNYFKPLKVKLISLILDINTLSSVFSGCCGRMMDV
jgi:hypothetical protein